MGHGPRPPVINIKSADNTISLNHTSTQTSRRGRSTSRRHIRRAPGAVNMRTRHSAERIELLQGPDGPRRAA